VDLHDNTTAQRFQLLVLRVKRDRKRAFDGKGRVVQMNARPGYVVSVTPSAMVPLSRSSSSTVWANGSRMPVAAVANRHAPRVTFNYSGGVPGNDRLLTVVYAGLQTAFCLPEEPAAPIVDPKKPASGHQTSSKPKRQHQRGCPQAPLFQPIYLERQSASQTARLTYLEC